VPYFLEEIHSFLNFKSCIKLEIKSKASTGPSLLFPFPAIELQSVLISNVKELLSFYKCLAS
jgi:hypothetical protein